MQCAWLAAFPVRQWLAHEAMAERILERSPDTDLVPLLFSPARIATIAWERYGKELEHEGRMYDVVRSESDAAGNLILLCVDDERESKLMVDLGIAVRTVCDASGEQRATDSLVLVHLAKACPDGAACVACARCAGDLRRGVLDVGIREVARVIEAPPPRA